MSEQQNLQTIRNAYAAFSRGNIDAVLAQLTDDVVWETPGAAQIPYAGTFTGKDGVASFFQILAQTEDTEELVPQRFFADGDMVVVLGYYAARVKSTGKRAEAEFVHTFTFRGATVAKFSEYFDTAKYAKAYEQAGAVI